MAVTTNRISPARLERIRWQGEGAFRVLSYYCTIRWNRRGIGDYVRRVMGSFACEPDPYEVRSPPTPGVPPRYSLVDLGPNQKRRRFRLLHGDQELIGAGDAGEVLEHLFWHINSETFRTTGAFLLIHAGSVSTPAEEGVLLPADSGSGKSTLTAALVRAGFRYLSDEAGAIDPVTGRLYPYAKALSFKKDRPDALPELRHRYDGSRLMKRQWHLRAEEIRPDAHGRACEVRYVIAPRYEEGAALSVAPMSAAACAVELARCALNLPVYRSRALPLLADVARGARAHRMVFGDVADAVRAVSELTGTPLHD